MTLLALAIAPGLAICLYIFLKDTHNKEPKRLLLASFLLGILAIIPPFFIEYNFITFLGNGIIHTGIYAYAVVAFSEELSKFLVLRYYCYNRKSFDEPLDGIVYSVMVSMGFATIENISYVLEYGYHTAFVRMFLSVPAHATFAIVMGYFVGKAKFDQANSLKYMITGLFWAVFFHGTFDFFLFLQKSPEIKPYVSEGLLFAGAVVSYIIAIRLSRKHIKLHQQLSKQLFLNKPKVLEIRKATLADIPLIRELTFSVWPQTYASIISREQITYMLDKMYSETSLTKQMMDEGCTFLIVYENSHPVGFASYGEEEAGIWKLHKLYILQNQQGKGTGSFVIDYIINAIKLLKANALQLQVNRINKAKDFYEKLGFTIIKNADFDIGKGYFMNDYVMEKKLRSDA
ncbi:MAG TPA: GNAT family N-acetyltransferase [Chitinophagaceae bacterium]|nr:GNAT family N-acetyltransferase [Chitinophagaceae bacterium]